MDETRSLHELGHCFGLAHDSTLSEPVPAYQTEPAGIKLGIVGAYKTTLTVSQLDAHVQQALDYLGHKDVSRVITGDWGDVDSLAAAWAQARLIPCTQHSAPWASHKTRAKTIARECDALLALPGPGVGLVTHGVIGECVALDKRVVVVPAKSAPYFIF